MSLRMRLTALIGLLLLVSALCGSALVAWHAAKSVRVELRAALDVGAKAVRNGVAELANTDDRAAALRQLIATFNGNRHVRATWVDGRGQPIAASSLFVPAQSVPGWFLGLFGEDAGVTRLPVPDGTGGDGAIVLRTDPTNEVGEVWTEARNSLLVLVGFATVSALLIGAVAGHALRPLESLSDAFDRIGKGDYHGGVRERGPPELVRLAGGFNAMTRRLAAAAAQNRRLNERLLTLQAEERADLARDLHDEVGPLLFAAELTAATIDRLADDAGSPDIAAHARSIQETVGRMQRHVRILLGRLRPIEVTSLAVAIDRLAAFWRGRRPGISFTIAVAIEEDRIGDDLRETIYRVVREGMTNAIRHGKPGHVEVAVSQDDRRVRIEVVDDGIGMAAHGARPRDPDRLGLIGMEERVMAMAGSLAIRPGRDDKGLALIVELPCEQTADIAE